MSQVYFVFVLYLYLYSCICVTTCVMWVSLLFVQNVVSAPFGWAWVPSCALLLVTRLARFPRVTACDYYSPQSHAAYVARVEAESKARETASVRDKFKAGLCSQLAVDLCRLSAMCIVWHAPVFCSTYQNFIATVRHVLRSHCVVHACQCTPRCPARQSVSRTTLMRSCASRDRTARKSSSTSATWSTWASKTSP